MRGEPQAGRWSIDMEIGQKERLTEQRKGAQGSGARIESEETMIGVKVGRFCKGVGAVVGVHKQACGKNEGG